MKIKKMNEHDNKRILIIVLLLLIFLKMVLVMGHKMYTIPDSRYDDELMFIRAVSITNGKWLGAYNNVTLAKGAFFSIWLAFLHFLSIPMLIGNQVLYIISCLVFIWCIKKIIYNKKLLSVIFAALLFNPATLGNMQLLRIYRDGIFPALIILIFAGIIGMFLNRSDCKKMFICSAIAGIGLSSAWQTREDTFWILPFVIIAGIITAMFIIADRNGKNIVRKIIYLFIPFVFLIFSNLFISTLNYIAYGRFISNDYMSKDFQGAYGALTRVTHEHFDYRNPVPEEVRMKIYQVSPAFNELKPLLEGDVFEGWKTFHGLPLHDYYAHFMWAIRDAVANCGYYESPAKAKEYYNRLAKEVNEACDSGLLPSRTGKRSTLASPFSREYLAPTVKNAINAALFVIRFDGLSSYNNTRWLTSSNQNKIRDMELFLNQLSVYDIARNTVEIWGWAFDYFENVGIKVIDSMNNEIPATIIKKDSTDVYNHFNSIYDTALEARFSVRFEFYSDLDYYLFFFNESGEQIKISIKDENAYVEISNFIYHLEGINYDYYEPIITKTDKIKNKISNILIIIYKFLNPAITFISVFSLLILTCSILYRLCKRKENCYYNEIIILWGLLFAFVCRTVMIAYVSASSFPAINVLYLSSSYPIVIMFNCISMCCLFYFIRRYTKIKTQTNAGDNV